MLQCTVKFCGGCNPRYDRGAAYRKILAETASLASFSLPQEGMTYDVLLILRGCTGCPYLYEEIQAAHRIVCVRAEEVDSVCAQIKALATNE